MNMRNKMVGLAAPAALMAFIAAPAYAVEFTIDPREFDGFDDGPTAPLSSLGWELRTATQQFGTSSGGDWLPDAGSQFVDYGFGRIDAYNPYDIGDSEIVGLGQRDMTFAWDDITGTIGADGELSYQSGTINFYFDGDGGIGSDQLRTPDSFTTADPEFQSAISGTNVLTIELVDGAALADLELDGDGNLSEVDASQFDLFFEATFARDDFWATAEGEAFEQLITQEVVISLFGEAGGALQSNRNTVLNTDESTFTDADDVLYTHYAGGRRGTLAITQIPEPGSLALMGGALVLLFFSVNGWFRRNSRRD